jgi:hypothetical protein
MHGNDGPKRLLYFGTEGVFFIVSLVMPFKINMKIDAKDITKQKLCNIFGWKVLVLPITMLVKFELIFILFCRILYAKHFMSYGSTNLLAVINTWLLMVVQFLWRSQKRLSKLLTC